MKIIKTEIPDVVIIEPDVFGDDRGFFFESYNKQMFDEAVGISVDFVQDNHSMSSKGVLRGLHYQIKQPQGKLVRVCNGEVFDVVVDLRQSSDTFGQWVGERLSAENKRQVWVPPGFARVGLPQAVKRTAGPKAACGSCRQPASEVERPAVGGAPPHTDTAALVQPKMTLCVGDLDDELIVSAYVDPRPQVVA